VAEISETLTEHLPGYMTPAAVVWHESLPLTRNGKVDRGKLTAMATSADGPAAGAARTGPPTATEREVIELWAGILRKPPELIGPGSNFFDLGGDSLAAARVFTGIRKRFGVSITLDRLYDVRTVQAMAERIDAGRARDGAA
jgi:acyl carrier protein